MDIFWYTFYIFVMGECVHSNLFRLLALTGTGQLMINYPQKLLDPVINFGTTPIFWRGEAGHI